MKKAIGVLVLLVFAISAKAQFYVSGRIVDSASGKGMGKVSVENRNLKKGEFSAADGRFQIWVREGDYLIFSYVGYKDNAMQVQAVHRTSALNIVMKPRAVQLNDVIITKGYTPYQLDSIKRASLYKDAFDYKREKSVRSPISAVHQKFSKKHKNQQQFQRQVLSMEREKFIDSRYNLELVNRLMGWGNDSSLQFMRVNPMEYDYARAASELEIKLWIKYRAEHFRKTGLGVVQP